MYTCAILPDFLWFWYVRSIEGHAGFLSSTVGFMADRLLILRFDVTLGLARLMRTFSCRRMLVSLPSQKSAVIACVNLVGNPSH